MGTRSAVSSYSASSRTLSTFQFRLLLAAGILLAGSLSAQLTTGAIEGILRLADSHPVASSPIRITGAAGFRTIIRSRPDGRFTATLPYGRYTLSVDSGPAGVKVSVAPLTTTHLDLVIESSGALRAVPLSSPISGFWIDATRGRLYPEAFSLPGLLLSRQPSSVTEPLDFSGLGDNRLGIVSQRGFSWTDTRFKLHGMDGTDSYQPGRPVLLPDVEALADVVVRSAFAQTASSADGAEIGVFLAAPADSWHGALATNTTGAALSWTNLPPPADRGLVRQSDQFRWFTRDRLEIGGPLTRWADIYAAAAGEWASQTETLAAPGTDRHSLLLFGNVRGRVHAAPGDRIDALYSGSRIDLSRGGIPAGLEALTANRLEPSFILPGGFTGTPETDHLDFVQVGWTHLRPAGSRLGVFEVRYGYSIAHLDTATAPTGQSRIELSTGWITGSPPLANLAVRPRHEIEGTWQPPLATRHRILAGFGWRTSAPRNRYTTPSGANLITAAGSPAFVVRFNTPLDSREQVGSLNAWFVDRVSLTPSLSLDLGAFADFSRGSLPAQSSLAPAGTFSARPDLIVWNSLSPRVGLAWQVPHAHSLVLRGAYFRLYTPLAGRDLDFGNPNSLGGDVYQWVPAPWQPVGQGSLLLRFGGPYASISPALRRPDSDEFDIGAAVPFTPQTFAGIRLFRRDDKNRLAAIDTGVPAQAFTPVSILDPGPDGIPGTFDDQRLTVYAQNPATLGQDRYLLTNPPGLRTLDAGLLAEAGTRWRRLTLHASFVAEKSYGPTNPGNAVYENDPGIIGSLFLDPNSAINDSGRSFVDRAYVAKLQADYRLPPRWGGFEVAGIADYLDGLVFGRRLLVTGLPQGPFLVAATVRGSPGGGNRAQHVTNCNLRFSRRFVPAFGSLTISADILNLTNSGLRLQESDVSGTSFNSRLPVAIQPSRSLRIGLRYDF